MEIPERPVIEVSPTYNPDKTYTFTVDQFVFKEIVKALKVVEGKRNSEWRYGKKNTIKPMRNKGIICPSIRIIDPTPPPIVIPAATPLITLQVGTNPFPRIPKPEAPPKVMFNYTPIQPITTPFP